MSEIYIFRDNGENYGFTTGVLSTTFLGITCAPIAVTRSKLNITENFLKLKVTLTFPSNSNRAQAFLHVVPEVPIQVELYKDGTAFWYGRIESVSKEKSSIKVNCDVDTTSLEQQALHQRATIGCRHILYSNSCKVIKALHKKSYLESVSSNIITINTMVEPSGFFQGGTAEFQGQRRGIVTHVNQTITLAYPFTTTGTAILDLYRGCALDEADCASFNNLINFGGIERMPKRNIFASEGLL